MPIKFACPDCKNVIQVDSKMAGKKGKCKCGSAVTVPMETAETAPPSAGSGDASAFGASFDDLTDSDYNRESPFQQVYSPRKSLSTDKASLKRFEVPASKKKKRKSSKWKILIISMAVLLVLAGITVGVLFAVGVLPIQ